MPEPVGRSIAPTANLGGDVRRPVLQGSGAVPSVGTIVDGARLAALRDLGLLDTPAEEDFDRYTRLATELLGVPVSLVSLLDAERQFFKSHVGLTGALAEVRQTPLTHSFCQHAVATQEPLVVRDAREHPLVADNPAVRDFDVIAYAGMPLVLSDGHAVGAFCAIDSKPREWSEHDLRILADLAAAVRAQLELRRSLAAQSLHDRLTGLANRTLLAAQAHHLQAAAGTAAAGSVGAICIGLNAFALVNDAYGADIGDKLLTRVAERLAAATRGGDMLGRLEGDTFALIAPHITDENAAIQLAQRLSAMIAAEPFDVDGQPIGMTATVGVALGTPDSSGADLLARSNASMRASKTSGGRLQLRSSASADAADAQLRLRSALPGALDRGEIHAAYQPIVTLDNATPVGFEALARWRSPQLGGSVSPGQFIPAAERSGEIVRIGAHMLHSACAQLACWRADQPRLSMSVNLAPLQLELPDLPAIVEATLLEHRLPAAALTLEITEGVLIGAGAVQARNLSELRQLGVRIALDDFGTGYCALSYLTRFPIDQIKIDRAFIDALGGDQHNTELVRAILALAHALDLTVVAEGIETPAQHHLLLEMGCNLGQGYLFAPPRPPDDIQV